MNELQFIREAITTALKESQDCCSADPAAVLKMVEKDVVLSRFDPGRWCPEALVVAYTEDGLPSPYEYSFWERVTEIANQNGCKVYSFDVTHFLVGFFTELNLAQDVARFIEQSAKAIEENFRHRVENLLESNNISSPIEQIFYIAWEQARELSVNEIDPIAHGLAQHVLFPQFPVISDPGERYLIDFAVFKFDGDRYRQLVLEWRERQDPYSDGNWVMDWYPEERDEECNSNLKIAIELDSYKHHVERLSPAAFEYQKRRERFLQREEWTVFSFSGREVNRDPMRCVQEIRSYIIKNRLGR
jgi:hypothetical protein